MASIPGSVTVTGFIAPTDSLDSYPTHHEVYGKGGFRAVADLTERNAIPSDRRKEGMLVHVLSNGTTYQLDSDLSNWSIYTSTSLDGVHTSDIIAGENVSSGRIVYVDTGKVYLADKDVITDRHKIIGITKTSALINEVSTVYISGTVTNVSWSWSAGAVYAGDDGVPTQPEPSTGFKVQVGVALNATTILIDIDRKVEDIDLVDGGTF